MKSESNIDWFARGIALLGLLVATAAIFVPYIQNISDAEESLIITAVTEKSDGIIRLSDNLKINSAVQVPWIFTISNTGKIKLSITSFEIQQLQKQAVVFFRGLDGGATEIDGEFAIFPKILGSGESLRLRIYIGFMPTKIVHESLVSMFNKSGSLDAHKTFIELAKSGVTLYGGSAEYKKYEGGGEEISISSSSFEKEPIYKIMFKTGRGNVFTIVTSEMASIVNS